MFKKSFVVIFLVLIIFVNDYLSQTENKDNVQPFDIKVNVTVFDEKGNLVNDLKAEDIRIFEDGIEQKITQFESNNFDSNIGFVIDNTGSMRFQLDKIVDMSSRIINQLDQKDEAFIVRFVSTDKTTIWENWTADKEKLKKSINSMFIDGGQSAILDGLNLALMKISQRKEKEKTKKYSIILISDCEDRESVSVLTEFLNTLKKLDIQIFVIALIEELENSKNIVTKKFVKSKDNAENLANNLALMTNGRAFIFQKTNKEIINDTISKLITEIHSPFVVSYTSTNSKRNGKNRNLTIQTADDIKGGKRRGIIREGFVIPKD